MDQLQERKWAPRTCSDGSSYKPLRLLSSDYYFSLFCGSFSAVSKPNFASEYSFCSIFQDLHNEHAFAPPTTQNLQNFAQFCKILMTFPDFLKILLKFDEIVLFFGENFTEFRRNSRESQLIYAKSDFFSENQENSIGILTQF